MIIKLQSQKEKTIKLLPYHSFYGGHVPPRKIEPPFWQSASKKCKATRMPIWQQSPKEFQTSSAMKFATFHIKHV